jgi:hypothetical protein
MFNEFQNAILRNPLLETEARLAFSGSCGPNEIMQALRVRRTILNNLQILSWIPVRNNTSVQR